MIRWLLQRPSAAKRARRICRQMAYNARHLSSKQWLTVRYNPEWDSERAVVDATIREERKNA